MVSKTLTLTIVIPVFNEEDYLPACLDSIAAQSRRPDQVIVVDNNSSDNSLKVVARYPFVKILNEPKQGVTFARNRGFNAAKGSIIARIDGDSTLPPDWVEHILTFYSDRRNRKKAWTGFAYFYDIRWPRLLGRIYKLLGFDLNRWLVGHYMLWGSNMALTTQQWQAVKDTACRRADIHEDLDLSLHLVEAGYEIYFDKSKPVGASLRIGINGAGPLWHQLMLWPASLRAHKYASWPLVWLLELGLFCLSPVFKVLASPRARKPAWLRNGA